MRVVFMGTSDFSATILRELSYVHDVVGVYTRPDAVRGRGKSLVSTPVKDVASELDLPVFTPSTLRDPAEVDTLKNLAPDVICVAAYGAILPVEVLEIPRFGCINVHASLLPRWRGAAPIERAILSGDEEVGVCIMHMEEGLDTGAFCVRRAIPTRDFNVSQLSDELANLGAQALITALAQIESGTVFWVDQDESAVTYADKIAKGELNCDPAISALDNVRRVRASSSAHPARCVIAGRKVALTSARIIDDLDDAFDLNNSNGKDIHENKSASFEGSAIFARKRLILGCADGAFEVKSLKPDGKKDMDAQAFAAGNPALREVDGATWERIHE